MIMMNFRRDLVRRGALLVLYGVVEFFKGMERVELPLQRRIYHLGDVSVLFSG